MTDLEVLKNMLKAYRPILHWFAKSNARNHNYFALCPQMKYAVCNGRGWSTNDLEKYKQHDQYTRIKDMLAKEAPKYLGKPEQTFWWPSELRWHRYKTILSAIKTLKDEIRHNKSRGS